jgi:hypothetical protein
MLTNVAIKHHERINPDMGSSIQCMKYAHANDVTVARSVITNILIPIIVEYFLCGNE